MEYFLFIDRHKEWLNAIIDARNRINHYLDGGIGIHAFSVFRLPDGTIAVPMWNQEQKLGDAMDGVWVRFVSFVEDFIALSLNFRMPEEHSLMRRRVPADAREPPRA